MWICNYVLEDHLNVFIKAVGLLYQVWLNLTLCVCRRAHVCMQNTCVQVWLSVLVDKYSCTCVQRVRVHVLCQCESSISPVGLPCVTGMSMILVFNMVFSVSILVSAMLFNINVINFGIQYWLIALYHILYLKTQYNTADISWNRPIFGTVRFSKIFILQFIYIIEITSYTSFSSHVLIWVALYFL